MEKIFEDFIIVNINTLEALDYDGNLTSVMNNTKKFQSIKEVRKELKELDEPLEYAIYQVREISEYYFERVKDIEEEA